jgi:hypothetical protein
MLTMMFGVEDVGAGAESRYGSGSNKLMRLYAASRLGKVILKSI